MKKRISSIVTPFVGNGKLTEYKDKQDSWIYNQISKGKTNPGIEVLNDEFIRFSAIKNRMAARMVLANTNIQIIKTAKQLASTTTNNYRYQFCWRLAGDIDKSTIEQLNLVKELLQCNIDDDIQKFSKQFNVSVQNYQKVFVDFETKNLTCNVVLSFVVNILTDNEKIAQKIQELGFEQGEY